MRFMMLTQKQKFAEANFSLSSIFKHLMVYLASSVFFKTVVALCTPEASLAIFRNEQRAHRKKDQDEWLRGNIHMAMCSLSTLTKCEITRMHSI